MDYEKRLEADQSLSRWWLISGFRLGTKPSSKPFGKKYLCSVEGGSKTLLIGFLRQQNKYIDKFKCTCTIERDVKVHLHEGGVDV